MASESPQLLLGPRRANLEERYYADIRPRLYRRFGLRQQHGIRTGSTLAEHLDAASQLVLTVSKLAGLDEETRQTVLAATVVHDLNKLDPQHRTIPVLARDPQFLREQLDEAGVLSWVDTPPKLELIRKLIERHSGHHVSDPDAFLPEDPLVDRLAALVRAGDLIDLPPDKIDYERKVGTELTVALKRPCRLFRVRVNEQRGYLTALLLEAVDECLGASGLHPLSLFPDGTLFVGERWPEHDLLPEVTALLNRKLNEVFSGNLEALVNPTKDGIKIQDTALLQDENEIIRIVEAHLEKKRRTPLKKIQDDVDKWGKKAGQPAIAAAVTLGVQPASTIDDFIVAEGLKTAYLSYREAGQSPTDAWSQIGKQVGLSEQQIEVLAAFDAQYGRPLFAASASRGLDTALSAVRHSLGLRRQPIGGENPSAAADLQRYIERVVSWPQDSPATWTDTLAAYVNAKPVNRCSLGATEGDEEKLNSASFPEGIKVQIFANRLPGGMPAEPLRRGNTVAALSYKLLTIGGQLPRSDKAGKALYAHLALPANSSPALRATWRDWIMDLAATNVESGPVAVDDVQLLKRLEVRFRPNKVVGIVCPRRQGFVHNQVILPLYWGDVPESVTLLRSLRLILEIAVSLNMPFVLSPGLELDDVMQDFGRVMGIPASLQRLVGEGRFSTWADARDCLQRLRDVGILAITVCGDLKKIDSCLYEISCTASGPVPLELYGVLLRWHLRTRDEDKVPFYTQIPELSPPLNRIMESFAMPESSRLTQLLRQAAALAVRYHIRGSSYKRTAVTEPIMSFLEAVRQQKPHQDMEFIFAALTQDYHSRLDRIREHGVGRTKLEQLKEYFGTLKQLYQEVYQGRPERLAGDEKSLPNAYLFFFHEASNAAKQEELQPV